MTDGKVATAEGSVVWVSDVEPDDGGGIELLVSMPGNDAAATLSAADARGVAELLRAAADREDQR